MTWKGARGYFKEALAFRDGNWLESVTAVGGSLADLFECVTIVLFSCLTQLASMSIQTITDDVKSPFQPSKLMVWKRSYCATANFIRQIDDFFGGFLVILFTKQHIGFFIYLFSLIFDCANDEFETLSSKIGYLLKVGSMTSVVTFETVTMARKVSFHLDLVHDLTAL